MYILYLDDSGSIPNQREKVFVLGGVIIPEEKIFRISKRLNALAATISPENPLSVEFHACDVFSGRKSPWNSLKEKETRIEVIKSVLQICKHEGLISLASVIDKLNMEQDVILAKAFEGIISRFQWFLALKRREKNQNAHGMVVLDKSSSERAIQNLARDFWLNDTCHSSIAAIQEAPFFVDSRTSRAIQLADNVAYTVFREYNARDLSYTDVFRSQFCLDRDPKSKIYGLFHHIPDNLQCECAACLRSRLGRPGNGGAG